MNSGQCHRRRQFQFHGGLDMHSPYTESPESPAQTYPFSFDGLPRAPEQHFLTVASPPPNPYSSSYNLSNPMSMSPSPTLWAGPSQISTNLEDLNNSLCYNYSPNTGGNEPNCGPYVRNGPYNYTSVPRTMPYEPGFPNEDNMSLENLEPSLYLDPNKSGIPNVSIGRYGVTDESLNSSSAFQRLSISRGSREEGNVMDNEALPFESRQHSYRVPSSDSDVSGHSSRETTAVDAEDNGTVEPYAKQIYRALMSVSNHSMVLQEIYQWFRENTKRGSSDSKGWMNSIRHNLSMNAAFKKTERKVPGDETKKSTEWVLEDFAVRDGVQSTTRYRKGNGMKKFKSDNPAPARQSSGRKGGICASKTKLQRQRIKEDRTEIRTAQRFDRVRRSQFRSQGSPQTGDKRQRSPVTPPSMEHTAPSASSPYFLPKAEHYDIPFEDICSLQDVQAVCIDESSPLFSNCQDSYFPSGHTLANNAY